MLQKSCVYCGNPANTHDHVPPKLIYLRPLPLNLVTVPCCDGCNQNWSTEEQYFKIALSFMCGTASDFMHEEGGFTDKTLTYAPQFEEMILKTIQVDENNRVYFDPDQDRLFRVIEKIVLGLLAASNVTTGRTTVKTIALGPADAVLAAHRAVLGPQVHWNVVQPDSFSYCTFNQGSIDGFMGFCALRFYNSLVGLTSCEAV